jgi:Flp pilus assembly protein TadB
MTSLGPRLERRLDEQLGRRERGLRAWLAVWSTLVLLGFAYPLALTTRFALAVLAAAFATGRVLVGALLLAALAAYLLQLPLVADLVRDRRRAD